MSKTMLIILLSIILPLWAFSQDEYYYDFDKHVTVEYSDSFLAIEINDNFTDWSSFFDQNDFLERAEDLYPMPNGMYLMKLKEEADIGSSLDQLSNNVGINRIIRSWKRDDAQFLPALSGILF